jgi:hypothetical protein
MNSRWPDGSIRGNCQLAQPPPTTAQAIAHRAMSAVRVVEWGDMECGPTRVFAKVLARIATGAEAEKKCADEHDTRPRNRPAC